MDSPNAVAAEHIKLQRSMLRSAWALCIDVAVAGVSAVYDRTLQLLDSDRDKRHLRPSLPPSADGRSDYVRHTGDEQKPSSYATLSSPPSRPQSSTSARSPKRPRAEPHRHQRMVGHDAFDYVSSTPGRQRTSSTSSTSSMASLATINSYTEQSSVRLRTGRHSFSSASSLSHMPSPAARPFRRKTLVLDLDETLIHSTSRGSRQYDCMIEVAVEGHHCLYYVYKRPHVDFFLQKVAEWYRVVVFTASLPEYADPVIDFLDGGKGWVSGRYFRSSCISAEGTFLKDLTVVDRNLAQVILVDNSPMSYALNQANGIPIEGWISDQKDEALLDLLPFLDALRFTEDVRSVLSLRLCT